MTIGNNLTTFAGQPVTDYSPETGIQDPGLCYRIRTIWDEDSNWLELFKQFVADPQANQVTHLVVGAWTEMWDRSTDIIVEAIVKAQPQLPNLTALFIGDVTYEENEISWIIQSDLSPLIQTYPKLTHFGARGGNGLRFINMNHNNLQHLVVETGGLDRQVVHDILSGHLPAITHLELWLGTSDYGGTVATEDLAPLLTGTLFPLLRYLGLRDSEIADEVAAAVALSPIIDQIEVLDLSLGILTDRGAATLLKSPSLHQLKKLDLHHHYLSQNMMDQLRALPITVDLSDARGDDEDDWRYVAVGE